MEFLSDITIPDGSLSSLPLSFDGSSTTGFFSGSSSFNVVAGGVTAGSFDSTSATFPLNVYMNEAASGGTYDIIYGDFSAGFLSVDTSFDYSGPADDAVAGNVFHYDVTSSSTVSKNVGEATNTLYHMEVTSSSPYNTIIPVNVYGYLHDYQNERTPSAYNFYSRIFAETPQALSTYVGYSSSFYSNADAGTYIAFYDQDANAESFSRVVSFYAGNHSLSSGYHYAFYGLDSDSYLLHAGHSVVGGGGTLLDVENDDYQDKIFSITTHANDLVLLNLEPGVSQSVDSVQVNNPAGSVVFAITKDGHLSSPSSGGLKIGTASSEKFGFWNAAPVVQNSGWSVSNVSTLKAYDASTATLNQVADTLGTLIETLKTYGILGG